MLQLKDTSFVLYNQELATQLPAEDLEITMRATLFSLSLKRTDTVSARGGLE